MSDPIVFTRREFLQTSLVMVSAATLVPSFLHQSALAANEQAASGQTSLSGVPQDRVLVVVQLGGGNDGLNTVVPYSMPEYYRARPMIGIKEAAALKLDSDLGLGLNPDMQDLKALFDQGNCAVIQGVGYPNPNRSHFVSMDIWQTADPSGGKGLGWLGKALDAQIAANPALLAQAQGGPCICVGNEAPLATHGKMVQAVSISRPDLFRWVGGDLHDALPSEYNQILNAAQPTPDANDPLSFVTRTAMDAQVASSRIRAAVSQTSLTTFPGNGLANQLRMVSSMIRAGLPARVYYVTLGGFDTHANQPGSHGRRLQEFSSAVKAFYAELAAMRQQDRVLTMAFSEFGRRVGQNASNGTDHGTAGPMFLFGPMVNSGVHGTHPSLTDLDNGDLIHTTDFRSVYATVLNKWLKVDATKVLGKPFEFADVLNSKKLA
jgi:uncharacterized protein (DUF1501 family)